MNNPGRLKKETLLKEEKSVKETRAEMVQIVLPNDTNALGYALGGKVMHWIDIIAGVTAKRHSRCPVVTASMETLEFHYPIKVGSIVILESRLVYVGNRSMVVDVDVFSEEPFTGVKKQTSTATLTFVALGEDGKPSKTNVPRLTLLTQDEKNRFKEIQQKRRKDNRI